MHTMKVNMAEGTFGSVSTLTPQEVSAWDWAGFVWLGFNFPSHAESTDAPCFVFNFIYAKEWHTFFFVGLEKVGWFEDYFRWLVSWVYWFIKLKVTGRNLGGHTWLVEWSQGVFFF